MKINSPESNATPIEKHVVISKTIIKCRIYKRDQQIENLWQTPFLNIYQISFAVTHKLETL